MAALVLIPGLAADAAMWRDQVAALRDFRPAVADVHMRHATIEAMASSLLEEHPGELLLCGASMGGMIAMEAARQAPARVQGLALLGTSARPESDEMRAMRATAIVLFEQGLVAEVIEPNVAFAFHPRHAADRSLVQFYLDLVLRAGPAQLIRQNRAVMARPDARVHLAQLRCPTLVLYGDADQLTPPECAREIASLIPAAELVELPECGHMLTLEQPQRVNEELLRWLARSAATRTA